MKTEYPKNWKEIAALVRKRDNYKCAVCGKEFPCNSSYLQVHHKIPISKGGNPIDPNNLISLCLDCHKDCHFHMKKSFKRKYKPLVK